MAAQPAKPAPKRPRPGRPREHPTPAKFGPVRINPRLYEAWTKHMQEHEPHVTFRAFFERALANELARTRALLGLEVQSTDEGSRTPHASPEASG